MKKQLFALIGLGLLLATASAYAQTVELKANIPFNFIVQGETLPAGEYMIEKLSSGNSVLAIRSSDQQTQKTVLAIRCESLNASPRSRLLFHRYGDQYFLSQIWVAGNNSGQQLPKSRRESEVAMDYTVKNVNVVAALR